MQKPLLVQEQNCIILVENIQYNLKATIHNIYPRQVTLELSVKEEDLEIKKFAVSFLKLKQAIQMVGGEQNLLEILKDSSNFTIDINKGRLHLHKSIVTSKGKQYSNQMLIQLKQKPTDVSAIVRQLLNIRKTIKDKQYYFQPQKLREQLLAQIDNMKDTNTKVIKVEQKEVDLKADIRQELDEIKINIQSIKNGIKPNKQIDLRSIKQEISTINKAIINLQTTIKKIKEDCFGTKEKLSNKIQKSKSNQSQNSTQISQIITNTSIKEEPSQEQQEIECLYDRKSEYFSRYKIKGKQIQLINNSDGWYYQLYGSIPFIKRKTNLFTIDRAKGGRIWVGLIDPKWINDPNSLSRKQCVIYAMWIGEIYQNGLQKSKGHPVIKTGHIVQMTVQGNKVTWKVNDSHIFYYKDSLINENWVPFIMMAHIGDKLSWQ